MFVVSLRLLFCCLMFVIVCCLLSVVCHCCLPLLLQLSEKRHEAHTCMCFGATVQHDIHKHGGVYSACFLQQEIHMVVCCLLFVTVNNGYSDSTNEQLCLLFVTVNNGYSEQWLQLLLLLLLFLFVCFVGCLLNNHWS